MSKITYNKLTELIDEIIVDLDESWWSDMTAKAQKAYLSARSKSKLKPTQKNPSGKSEKETGANDPKQKQGYETDRVPSKDKKAKSGDYEKNKADFKKKVKDKTWN